MEIKPLYIPLKNLQGELNHSQTLSNKARESIRKYGKAPKGRRGCNYNVMHKPDATAIRSTQALMERVEYKTKKTYKVAAAKDVEAADVILCKFRVSLRLLCKAWLRERKSWSEIEQGFYHVNTEYLALNRLAFGEHVKYYDHINIACTDHFIPPKQRRFGKRITK